MYFEVSFLLKSQFCKNWFEEFTCFFCLFGWLVGFFVLFLFCCYFGLRALNIFNRKIFLKEIVVVLMSLLFL